MRHGRRVRQLPALSGIRDHYSAEMQALPLQLRELTDGLAAYPVSISDTLQAIAVSLDAGRQRGSR
jgi:hypothetical protein